MRRKQQQQQFFFLLGGIVAHRRRRVVHRAHLSRRAASTSRRAATNTCRSEIAKLDKQIDEIQKLKEQTAALLARKRVVETLQSNRSEAVHLLDQLVRQLPDGVYLKAVKQTGDPVNITGFTQSKARVSTLMRNLEASPWLENPSLVEIKAVPGRRRQRSTSSSLNVSVTRPKDDGRQGRGEARGQGRG